MSDISLRGGHTTIHSNHAYDDAGGEECRHQGQQKPSVPGLHAAAAEPMTAVQVVDRLRWWRTRRLREHPIPVDHVVLRGSYSNYSSFGNRPLAPDVSRLLQKARTVRAQYLRAQQQQEAQRQRRQGSSLLMVPTARPSVFSASTERQGSGARETERATSCVAAEEEDRHSERQHRQAREVNEEVERLDNKRSSVAVARSPRSPRPLSEEVIACLGEPAMQRDLSSARIACTPLSAPGSVGTSLPLFRAAAGSARAFDGPSRASCAPSEQEARAAERLITLFRQRATSAPLRSRRHWHDAGYLDNASRELCGEASLQLDWGCANATERHHGRMARALTSDEITDVPRASGAAEAVVVLHHAPRLILYEKGLNPKAALRAACISSDALEGLNDTAAENSADIFAMSSLPLCAFERFFYQQQLRGLTESRPVPLPAAADADENSTDAPARDAASALTGAVAVGEFSADEDAMMNGDGAFFFGAPLTAILARSKKTAAAPSLVAAGARRREPGDAAARQAAPHRNRGRCGGSNRRRKGGRAMLRAVSVPILPPVYRGGCPQMATAASHRHGSPGALPQRQRPQAANRLSSLPAGLRSGTVPQESAHLCLRVDDLQDVYVFNPIVDMIGKGAFSKVYAAIPILRGSEGLRRFASPLLGGQAGAYGSDEHGASGRREGGRPASLARRASPMQQILSSPGLHVDPAAGATVGGTVGALTDDVPKHTPHTQPPATPLRSAPVVALKIIPRKARRKSKAAQDLFTNAPLTAAAVAGSAASNAQQAGQNDDNSVRRELVEIEREVSILRRLHHTGCSQFFEAIRTPDAFVIAMRVFPGSMDAQHYLSRYGAPSEARAALLLFQLVATVQYLHTNFGLIHRDIKLENILLSEADASVPDARIREVLGASIHKSDTTALMAEDECGRQGCTSATTSAENRSGAQLCYSTLSHNVARLLRVTLIDFGLARRTRPSALSPTTGAARVRGAGVRHASLNTSITSPTNLASFPPTSASLAAGSPLVHHNPHSNSYSGGLGSPATLSAGGAAGVATLANGGNSTGSGHASAKQAPSRPPVLSRSSSSVVGSSATRLGPGGAGISGVERSTSRVGMPSPMPSTANMFTRFLDLEEEMDEDENGGGGAPGASIVAANTVMKAGGLSRGSRQAMSDGDDDSGAFSTDVSASETDFESEGGSATETKDDTQDEEVCGGPGPAQEHRARPALLSPIVLTAQPHAQPEAAMVAPPPPPPTISLPTGAAAAIPDHFNAANNANSCKTNGPVPGGAALRNRGPSRTHTSLHQLPSAPLGAATSLHSAPDDTDATLLLTPCGTEKYLPPEVLSWILEHGWVRRSTTVGLARAMDLYPIGIVAYVLLSGCFPFNASSRATLLQQQQRVPRCNSARWAGISSAAISFVQRLLEPNPRKRMTAKEALGHPFLQEARQLAEKLSLVPHGEGEELPHPSTWRDVSHSGNHHHHSTGSTGRHLEDNTNMQAWLHWASSAAPTASTPATNVARSAPLSTHIDHMRSATPDERASAHPNTALSLAAHGDQRRHAAGAHGLATTNAASELSKSSGVCHNGGSEMPALLRRGEGGTARTETSANSGCNLSGSTGRRRDSDEHEVDAMTTSMTNDVLDEAPPLPRVGKESPRPPEPPAAVTPGSTAPAAAPLAGVASIDVSAASLAAPPLKLSPCATSHPITSRSSASAGGECTKRVGLLEAAAAIATSSAPELAPRNKDAAAANRDVSRLPAATTATTRTAEGGGDDLFESLYNDIMFSD
ncbi:hypothetical protein GH5_05234 [Leishmania sp. Ghana 2012 LV757]|uniref:hypothetical protein n=1 Tax=Leishmania sp. Ghana 2012 LV757 TaxID=2803181 RepID=UPI001B67D948|nr:hypothetical protein GH5_05234 [Leishmania sp. Ghana 2012 LV757]